MAITGYSGTLDHGNTITLTGTGLGDKSAQPGPSLYDDFSGGSHGSLVDGDTPVVAQGSLSGYTWDTDFNTPAGPTYSNVTPPTRHALHVTGRFTSGWYSRLQWSRTFNTTGQKAYLSWYQRVRVDGGTMPGQCKVFILYHPGAGDVYYFSTAFDNCQAGGWRSHITESETESFHGVSGPEVVGEWTRMELYLKQSAVSTGNGDAEQTIWRNALGTPAVARAASNNVEMRSSATSWATWTVGGAYYNQCSSEPGNMDAGPVYFDDSTMRVELGNASTYAACTRMELQRATAWNAGGTSINVVLNVGYFGNTDSAWFYVMDANNDPITTAGFAVTLAATGGGDPDIVAPVLSIPSDGTPTSGGCSGASVNTDENNGTLYWACVTNAGSCTDAQLKAGTGGNIVDVSAGSQAVTATGPNVIAEIFGLSISTTYQIKFLHQDTAANDSAQASVDLVTTSGDPGTFSTAVLLDDFTGTPTDPLPTYDSTNWGAITGTSNLLINAAGDGVISASGVGANYWKTGNFGAELDVTFKIKVKAGADNYVGTWIRGVDLDAAATADGYLFIAYTISGAADVIAVYPITNGVSGAAISSASQEVSAGDEIGLRLNGPTLTLYYKAAAGSWIQIGTPGNDSTYAAAGQLALICSDAVGEIDDVRSSSNPVIAGSNVGGSLGGLG